jgi:hypothetical protein
MYVQTRSRLNSGNGCYNSIQNFLPTGLLSNSINNIQKYKFCVFLYGYEFGSLALKELHRLRVSEIRVLRMSFRVDVFHPELFIEYTGLNVSNTTM